MSPDPVGKRFDVVPVFRPDLGRQRHESQRRDGHAQHVLLGLDPERDVRRHAGHQLQCRVRRFDDDGIGHDVLRGRGVLADLVDVALEQVAGVSVHGELGDARMGRENIPHADAPSRADQADVGLIDRGIDVHVLSISTPMVNNSGV